MESGCEVTSVYGNVAKISGVVFFIWFSAALNGFGVAVKAARVAAHVCDF